MVRQVVVLHGVAGRAPDGDSCGIEWQYIISLDGCKKEGREDEHEDEHAQKTAQYIMKKTRWKR